MRGTKILKRAASTGLAYLLTLLPYSASAATQTQDTSFTIPFTINASVSSLRPTQIISLTPTILPFDRYLGRLTQASVDYTVNESLTLQDLAVGGTPFASGTASLSFGPTTFGSFNLLDGSPRVLTMPSISGSSVITLVDATGADNYPLGLVTSTVTMAQGLYPLSITGNVSVNVTTHYTYDDSPAQLAPSSSMIDFGTTLVGVPSTKNLTVANTGGRPANVTFSRALQSPAFSPTNNTAPITIFGGDSYTRAYTHSAAIRGTDAGYMDISYPSNNPVQVLLKAKSVAPVASLATTNLNFGNVRLGTTMFDVFGVYNNGDGSLANAGDASMLSAHMNTPTGPFSLGGSPDAMIYDNLAALGANLHYFSYTFSPTSRGPVSQAVNVHTDNGNPDGTNTAADLASKLSGNGVGPLFHLSGQEPGRDILFSQTTPSTVTLDVLNESPDGAALGFLDALSFAAWITNDPNNAFSIVGSAGGIVTAAGDRSLQIRFDPAAVPAGQTYQAMLTFNTDQDTQFGNLNGRSYSFLLTAPASVPEPSVILCLAAGLTMLRRRI